MFFYFFYQRTRRLFIPSLVCRADNSQKSLTNFPKRSREAFKCCQKKLQPDFPTLFPNKLFPTANINAFFRRSFQPTALQVENGIIFEI